MRPNKKQKYLDAIEDHVQKHKSKSHEAGSMEDYVFTSKEEAEKMAKKIGLSGSHSHKSGDGVTLYMPGKDMKEFQDWYEEHSAEAAFKYENPRTGEVFTYRRMGNYKKDGVSLVYKGRADEA